MIPAQVLVYPVGIPALYAWQLHANRLKINPPLERLVGESDEALQMRKIKVRDADHSNHHLRFLFEERAPALFVQHRAIERPS